MRPKQAENARSISSTGAIEVNRRSRAGVRDSGMINRSCPY